MSTRVRCCLGEAAYRSVRIKTQGLTVLASWVASVCFICKVLWSLRILVFLYKLVSYFQQWNSEVRLNTVSWKRAMGWPARPFFPPYKRIPMPKDLSYQLLTLTSIFIFTPLLLWKNLNLWKSWNFIVFCHLVTIMNIDVWFVASLFYCTLANWK